MKRILRTLRTVRHLQARQIYWQLRNRLWRRWTSLPAEACDGVWRSTQPPAPGHLDCARWRSLVAPVPPQSTEELLTGTFRFLNTSRQLFSADVREKNQVIDWQCEGTSLLWRYNLHYFDWLWSLDPQEAQERALIERAVEQWWECTDQAAMKVGWSPYPLSLRLLNWTILFFGRWHDTFQDDPEFLGRLTWAIQRQRFELEKRLEFHLGANHLLENLVAIQVVDAIIGESFASNQNSKIQTLLKQQLQEQFLPDGCHYERSPMYQQRMLWLLDVLRRIDWSDQELAAEVTRCYEGAQKSLCLLSHADGQIALLNDAAFDIYNAEILDRSCRKLGTWSLPDAGYFGVHTADGESLIIDAGPIGPDHQPGHAHADTFSFEWSLDGDRFITDTGVYDYEVNPFRLWTRQTAAHNSVTVDGRDSSEVWSGFRVGRRARVTIEKWEDGDQQFELSARHDGYSPRVHGRTFEWSPGRLRLTDRVSHQAGEAVDACGYLHFAPEIEVELSPQGAECRLGRRRIQIELVGCDAISLQDSWYCPRFGVKVPRKTLKFSFGDAATTCITTLRSEFIGVGDFADSGR